MIVVMLESYREISIPCPYFPSHLQTRMASIVDHFVMPPTVGWYYDGVPDAVVVATTTTTYTLLDAGHLNNLAEVPPFLHLQKS